MADHSTPSSKVTENRKTRLVSILCDKGWEPGSGAGWSPEEVDRNYDIIAKARLKSENHALAAVAIELLAANAPDTVRGVMYSVVSAGWLPDTGKVSYSQIQRLLNSLRKQGVISFKWIVDNIRETMKPSSWSGLQDFAETVAESYRKDFWAGLPECVEVIVEKDTVAGRVYPVTKEYDVPLHPLRGYSSTSYVWSIGRSWRDIQKPINVYYIGDHDPSGRDIERSVREWLTEYSDGKAFTWHRLAVTPEQFEQYNIIPLEPKKADRRYAKFAAEYGDRCAEVEAIPAGVLRDMVRKAIESHIPPAEWARLKRIEQAEKEEWHRVMNAIGGPQ